MQPQQRSRGVSTDFDRFITHPAPLEPISVVRFARYLGRRYHSPQQLRFVPLLVDVWRTETSDKRAPGGISYTNTVFTPIETMHRGATPQSTSLKRLAVFDLSLVATTLTTGGLLVQKGPFHVFSDRRRFARGLFMVSHAY